MLVISAFVADADADSTWLAAACPSWRLCRSVGIYPRNARAVALKPRVPCMGRPPPPRWTPEFARVFQRISPMTIDRRLFAVRRRGPRRVADSGRNAGRSGGMLDRRGRRRRCRALRGSSCGDRRDRRLPGRPSHGRRRAAKARSRCGGRRFRRKKYAALARAGGARRSARSVRPHRAVDGEKSLSMAN